MPNPTQPTPGGSRRDFLKLSGTAAVAGSLAGSLSIARFAHAQGDDQIKVGLIGCGGRGTGAASQALKTKGNVKLVAMGDAFTDRLEGSLNTLQKDRTLAERIDVPEDRRFTGFDAYKQVLGAGVDLVILATPPGFRPIHFKAAVEAGKHVFMEKPVAVDAPGVRTVLAAAEEAKKKNLCVGVGLQRRHQAPYLETIKKLQDGTIGDIVAMRAYWNGAGVWVNPRKPGQTEMEFQMRNWYYFNWLCGDHIVEQHIHNLDVINWLKNAFPVRAQGMGGREVRVGEKKYDYRAPADMEIMTPDGPRMVPKGERLVLVLKPDTYGEIYDHHHVEFEYADGSRMYSYCRHMRNTWPSVTEHCQGTKGSADISGATISVIGQEAWKYRGPGGNPYQVEHDDLFAAIRSGTPYNEAEYGALSSMTAVLGRLATYSGKVISWNDALNSDLSLGPKEYSFTATPPEPTVAVPGETQVV
jgi:predicted dehydrogenase